MKNIFLTLLILFGLSSSAVADPTAVQIQINANNTQINALNWSCTNGCITGATMKSLLLATNVIETAINTLFTTFVPTNSVPLGNAVSASSYATLDLAVATGLPIYLPAGTYTYTGSSFLTISQDLTFASGATIVCNSNNVGINGAINAGRNRIFSVGCTPSLFSNKKLTTTFPEWWGGAGDSSGATGNGTDNGPVFQTVLNSGAPGMNLAAGSYRMGPNVSSQRTGFALTGLSRDVSRILIDDPAGVDDGFFFHGSTGELDFHDIGIARIQGAVGLCGWAYPIAFGAGYIPSDTIVMAGGTNTTPCTLTVNTTQVASATIAAGGSGGTNGTQTVTGTTGTGTKFQASVTVSGNAITAVLSITVGGAYTANPTTLTNEPVTGASLSGAALNVAMGVQGVTPSVGGSYSAAPLGAVSQASTSGAGTGATFWLTWGGPGDLHVEDAFYVQVRNMQLGGANSWNPLVFNSNTKVANKYYVNANQIFSARNDGVFIYGTSSFRFGDSFIENHNYIMGNGRAGIEFFQNIGGSFVSFNGNYNNGYAIIADVGTLPVNSINDLKVRANDEDTNSQGSRWRGVGSSMYQDNWHSTGRWYCELCTQITATSNMYEGASTGVQLLGSQGVNLNGSHYSVMNNAILLGVSGNSPDKYISATGSTFVFGTGAFIAESGSPAASFVTFGVQTDAAALVSGTINNVTNLGSDPTNVNDDPTSFVFGQSNTNFAANSGVIGYANNVNCYASFAFGQSLLCQSGSYVRLAGLFATNNGVNNTDCFSSGEITARGDPQECYTGLTAATSSTTPTYLTTQQESVGAATVITLPNNSQYRLDVILDGIDLTSSGGVSCDLSRAVISRGANAASTTNRTPGTAFTCAVAYGTGAGISVPTLTTDTTIGAVYPQVTPPNGDNWQWTAHMKYYR